MSARRHVFASLKKTLFRALPAGLQQELVLRRLAPAATPPADVEVGLADSEEALCAAAHLTYEAYQARAIVDGRGVPVRVTPYLMLPTTCVFVARRRGEVIGTVSLVQDSPIGLPMEAAFPAEVRQMRASGRKLAEVGTLAVAPHERGLGVPMLLYKAMWQMARQLGVQDLLIATHPDAEPMYRAPLCFARLSQHEVLYAGLTHARAIAMYLDLDTAVETYRRTFASARRGRFNPYEYFVVRRHAQLRGATSLDLERSRAAQTRAGLRLAALRPDMLLALDTLAFARLRRALASGQADGRVLRRAVGTTFAAVREIR